MALNFLKKSRPLWTSVMRYSAKPDENIVVESPTEEELYKEKPQQEDNILAPFFDNLKQFGAEELRPKERPGRSWNEDELRLKSNSDLHKLWFVLLKERNMLLTMKAAYEKRGLHFPNPEREDSVKESMTRLENVVHERNDAFMRLETGDSASPRTKRVTSPIGFTYEKLAEEHLEPFEVSRKKEYEIPYLDDAQYMTQKLWNEKQFMRQRIQKYDEYFTGEWTEDHETYRRGLRKHFKHVDHLPESIVKKREAEKQRQIEENC